MRLSSGALQIRAHGLLHGRFQVQLPARMKPGSDVSEKDAFQFHSHQLRRPVGARLAALLAQLNRAGQGAVELAGAADARTAGKVTGGLGL